jgi:hypothetical protein
MAESFRKSLLKVDQYDSVSLPQNYIGGFTNERKGFNAADSGGGCPRHLGMRFSRPLAFRRFGIGPILF